MRAREAARTFGCASLLFAVNAYITLRLFHTEYMSHMGSIEGAYLGLARYVSQHWNDPGWFPLWYGGIPFPDAYPPLLHWICALAISWTGASPALAHHFVTATLYSLGPAALFWMAWRLSGKRACSFVAALGFSLVSPTCLLVQRIRLDSDGYFGARRLINLVWYGEGPHIASLCLLPVAIGLVHVALEKRRPWYWVSAALAVAAVPMSNWLGAMALAIGIAAYLCSAPGARRAWIATAALGAYAYAVVAPWLSPSTIAVIRANAPRVAHNFQSDARQRVFGVAVVAAFLLGAWAMARFRVARHTRFAVLFLVVMAAATLGKAWFGLDLIPQAERYQLEMDMAFWLAAAFLVWPLVERMSRRDALLAAGVLAMACVQIAVAQRNSLREAEKAYDIRNSIEYRTAMWLEEHLPGARVFAPGSIGFWLNAFTDTPQITGGFDNGILNSMLPHLHYWIYSGGDPRLTVELLRAYGCDAIVGGGKNSAEFYHPFAQSEQLAGLTALWRDGGDVIYEIPRRSRSLAHAMLAGDILRSPVGYDSRSLQPYLAALDNPGYPAAAFRWREPSAATVTADLRPDHVLSVQITWDEGWHGSVSGRPVPVWGDKLGQMVVEPHCTGPCTVELKYDGGAEARWTRAISRLALAGGALWILVVLVGALWRKRSDSPKTS